jgi:aryl-alcohol dehydrogenase-like predicted oxidoreductase/enamine deaminase RidA (YjgF/YER057c/UK114 family)
MAEVQYIKLAEGLTVCRVITGMWQIADLERSGETQDHDLATAAMDSYVSNGLTTFDMADHYGSAELIAGEYSNRQPGQITCLTKWVPEPGAIIRAEVRHAVERALSRLQREQLDLMQFHTWRYCDPSWLDALFYLQELKDEGLIRALGVTNFDSAHLQMALESGIDIVSNQVSFSLIDQRAAGALAGVCDRYGVKLLAYGTVAGGFLSERWLNQPDPGLGNLTTWSQMKYYRFIQAAGGWSRFQGLLSAVAQIAAQRGVSVANIASRFILEHPAVAAVIIGARLGKSDHIADTLKLFSLILTDNDKAALQAALQQLDPIPGDCGDEYRRPPFLTASGDLSHHLASFPPVYPAEVRGSRQQVFSGTTWETMAGYCRAVRQGDTIKVSGTTATHGTRLIGGQSAAAQTHYVIDKLEGAITSLGGSLEDVVRTRIFIKNLDDWEAVARAHGERFGQIQPVNTLVQAGLVGTEYLVEIEAEAVVGTLNRA